MKSFFQMALVVCFVSAAVVAGLNAKATGFERSRILVDGEVFNVEMAISPEERSRGWMFRTEMANDAGMLFDFGGARNISMWMKNTFVSLDMLFADENYKIIFIKENAIPLSEDIISSPEKIRYVLEVPAGTVQRLGIEIGDSFAMHNTGQ